MHLPEFPNTEKPFDNNIRNKLKHYVYGLFDPKTGDIFYIGKGGGKDGLGNDRVFGHFAEAKDAFFNGSTSDKVEKIHEIWLREKNREVDWKILRSGLETEEEAFNVEAALIDTLKACGHKLLNTQGGHRSGESGVLERGDVYAWAAPKLDVTSIPDELRDRPIFIFNIQNPVKRMRKEGVQPDYVEATRRAWKMGEKWTRKENAIAIGLVDGISRAAFEIQSWHPDETAPKRWAMEPKPLPDDLADVLKEKSFSELMQPAKGYMQQGGFPVIKFPKGKDGVEFLRGAKKSTL